MVNPIKVLIVDDHELFRRAICVLLKGLDDMTVVGEAKDGREAVEMAGKLRPDVVLLDMNMPGMDGLQTVAQLSELHPGSRVIMFSAHDHQDLILEALRNGAWGYLVKGKSKPDEIIAAIRAVAREEAILSPRMMGWILDEMGRWRQTRKEGRESQTQSRTASQ